MHIVGDSVGNGISGICTVSLPFLKELSINNLDKLYDMYYPVKHDRSECPKDANSDCSADIKRIPTQEVFVGRGKVVWSRRNNSCQPPVWSIPANANGGCERT